MVPTGSAGKDQKSENTSSTSQSNQTENGTSTVSSTFTDPNLAAGVNNYWKNVGNLTYAQPGDMSNYIMGAAPSQTAAYGSAATLSNSGNPLYGTASSAITSGMNASAPTIAPVTNMSAAQIDTNDIQRLMNPFTNDVVNTTLAGFDQNAGVQQNALENQGALSEAFGGSRFGIAQGNLANQLAQTRAQTEAGLRSDAYNQAFSGAQYDASNLQSANQFNAAAANTRALSEADLQNQALARQLQGGTQLASIADSQGNQSRSDIATQLGAGADQRSVYQDQQTAYLQYLAELQKEYPGLSVGDSQSKTTVGTDNIAKTGSSTGKDDSTTTSMSLGFKG